MALKYVMVVVCISLRSVDSSSNCGGMNGKHVIDSLFGYDRLNTGIMDGISMSNIIWILFVDLKKM